ncbi:hypothetical protein G3A39_43495 [Paraburkholderia aspalathi]|nr:hypothetical protein [Paraburkholderia aspalathi]
MTDQEPKVILSALCQPFSKDGLDVHVEIYRLEDEDGWTLEVIDGENTSFVYEDLFATDQEALDAFFSDVEEHGLAQIITPDDDDEDEEPTVH